MHNMAGTWHAAAHMHGIMMLKGCVQLCTQISSNMYVPFLNLNKPLIRVYTDQPVYKVAVCTVYVVCKSVESWMQILCNRV